MVFKIKTKLTSIVVVVVVLHVLAFLTLIQMEIYVGQLLIFQITTAIMILVINMPVLGHIDVLFFDLEHNHDYLTSPEGVRYSIDTIGLNGSVVSNGDRFTFFSDYNETRPGLDLCLI
eukprot:Awhi_evm1s10277